MDRWKNLSRLEKTVITLALAGVSVGACSVIYHLYQRFYAPPSPIERAVALQEPASQKILDAVY